MGQEIASSSFSAAEHDAFRARLRQETALLKRWFDTRHFDDDPHPTIGLELEAWLIDKDHMPAPRNTDFFAESRSPDIVSELSRFNFEINAPARPLTGNPFSATLSDLESRWSHCIRAAGRLQMKPVAIGILPTVRDDMLQPGWMSDSNRYKALNSELLIRRGGQPLHIRIAGDDSLDYECGHIMLEAACTSLQAHLKIRQDQAARFYNAALLAAGPLIAATANSPFLYGKSLWAETRVPAFEQATATEVFRDPAGRDVHRVTLGTGYLRQSLLELFLENLSYPALLPSLEDDQVRLPHLRLQNGTIWRWVRPIVGFDGENRPHLRLEHRVMPAGPSLADTVANLALCHGLVLGLGRAETPPETETRFQDAQANLYACARHGLDAQVAWAGRRVNVQRLLIEYLVPLARQALLDAGLAAGELDTCFAEILTPRLRSGRTGADWQRSFIECNGTCFQALTERYVAHQESGKPVHEWAV